MGRWHGDLSVGPVTVPWNSWRAPEGPILPMRTRRWQPTWRHRRRRGTINPIKTQPIKSDQPDQDAGSVAGKDPLRFNNWMKRSATGAVITGIALGLHKALEPEKPPVPFVIEAGEPDDPDGLIDLRFDPDSPSGTVAIIRRPVTDEGSEPRPRPEPAQPGAQPDRHLPRRTVDDQHDADAVGQAGGGVGGKVPLERNDGEGHP